MIYVFVRSFRINKKYVFLYLNGVEVRIDTNEEHEHKNSGNYKMPNRISSKLNLRKGTYNHDASSLQLLMKYEEFVNEKREKYQVQLLLLKFCECFFHGIPQVCIQLYVFMVHKQHVYDTTLNLVVFYLSMITSTMALLQFLYECIFNTKKRHLIEIFQ